MDLLSLLRACGPDIWASRIKLIRHADPAYDLDLLLRKGFLEDYEQRQSRPVFSRCDYILSFRGEQGTRCRFLACRKVVGVKKGVPPFPPGHPIPEMPLGDLWYDLRTEAGFSDLEDRVVIDWGESRGWHQWLRRESPKRVIEVLPEDYVRDFPGYDNVVLSFEEMVTVIRNPDAHRTWHLMLGSVAGVYLITDLNMGGQYIGSAYGKGGILARWRSYAISGGHGGNERLRRLLAIDGMRKTDLQFSILRTLPSSMAAKEVIGVERIYKQKMGTRAHGLNEN